MTPAPPELDLAARVAARVAELDPHLAVERIDARTVRVESRTADVAALEALCALTPEACQDAIAAWAERLARPLDPATPESLAAILVPTAEVEAARAAAREAGLPEPIVGRAYTPPFFLALVSAEPDVLRQLEPGDLTALGTTDVAALEAIALRNADALPPLRHEAASPTEAPDVRVVTASDGLATTRLLLLSRWRAIAGTVEGALLVSAPSATTLLFTGNASERDVATLAYLARRIFVGQPGPVSPAILRLGVEGWVLESANDRPDPERDRALEAAYGARETPPPAP